MHCKYSIFLHLDCDDDICSIATDGMMENLCIVDCHEGIGAFVEKREAKWNHKYELLPKNPSNGEKK